MCVWRNGTCLSHLLPAGWREVYYFCSSTAPANDKYGNHLDRGGGAGKRKTERSENSNSRMSLPVPAPQSEKMGTCKKERNIEIHVAPRSDGPGRLHNTRWVWVRVKWSGCTNWKVVSTALLTVMMAMEDTPKKTEALICLVIKVHAAALSFFMAASPLFPTPDGISHCILLHPRPSVLSMRTVIKWAWCIHTPARTLPLLSTPTELWAELNLQMVKVHSLCRALFLRSTTACRLRPLWSPKLPASRRSRSSSSEAPFPVLHSQLESAASEDTARRNRDANLPTFAEVRAIRAAIEGADDEIRRKDRSTRKLTVRERIDLLRDSGSDVFHVGLFAGWKMPYGRVTNASNAVVVTKIAGETCVVSANIWTFKGGTLYPISVKKQLRAQEISMENRLPCIYLVDSGGAFLPLQVAYQLHSPLAT